MLAVAWLAEFHLRSVWNWRTLHYGRLVEPLLYYGLLVAGLSGLNPRITVDGASMSYAYFALPGAVGILCVRIWATTLVDVTSDRKWGVYALSRVGGASYGEYALSIVASQLAQTVVQLSLLVAIGGLLARDAAPAGLLLLGLSSLAVVLFWIVAGIGTGTLVNSYHGRDLVTSLGVLPLAFTAPLFYPIASAPAFLQAVSSVNPLRYQTDLLRDLTLVRPPSTATLIVCVALLIVVSALTWRLGRGAEWLTSEMG